jgi:hypothetical protein
VVYLQAEVFKYQVMGKWEAGKGEHQVAWLEREDWGGTGYCLGRPSGLGSFACSFSLTLLSGVAIFTLFQCSLAFQHSNNLDNCNMNMQHNNKKGDNVKCLIIPSYYLNMLFTFCL